MVKERKKEKKVSNKKNKENERKKLEKKENFLYVFRIDNCPNFEWNIEKKENKFK